MSKYEFIPYKRIDNMFLRLYVYPFVTLYVIQISVLISEILRIDEKISLLDIYSFVLYLVNYILSINSNNSYDVSASISSETNGAFILDSNVGNTTTVTIGFAGEDLLGMSDEVRLIMENIPSRYIVSILLTLALNIFLVLMTIWNLRFKCNLCYKKVTGDLELKETTHVLVKNKKYPTELCSLTYVTCVENTGNIKKKFKHLRSMCITRLNNLFVVQVDSIEYRKHRREIDSVLGACNDKVGEITWLKQIVYEKKTFVYNPSEDQCNKESGVKDREKVSRLIGSGSKSGFNKLRYPLDLKLGEYMDQVLTKGGLNEKDLLISNMYGINNYEIPTESFFDLFLQQIISPFFLFQIFCVLLWILDEYWQMSLFTLFMLCTLEAQMVFRRIKESEELKRMRRPQCNILVYREGMWKYVTTDNLLPGDIFAISPNPHTDEKSKDASFAENDITCVSPCDFLLLSGSITVNEAMLTGECTPKMKVSININSNERFCMNKYKNHVIFAGTNIILTRSTNNENDPLFNQTKKISNDYIRNGNTKFNYIPNKESVAYVKYDRPDMICIGYVLRTGFNTYQGKLIRTISSSNEKITSNSIESLLFLLLLIICSLIASSYILYFGLYDDTRNKLKLVVSCIHIITSVIPPEFPITLSIAVTMSVIQLTKKKIYCTEPFRIPYSGKLNICAFDKTGTLTSDKMNLHGLFGLTPPVPSKASSDNVSFAENNNTESSGYLSLIFNQENSEEIPFLSDIIMGCCNGLSLNGGNIIGDPMEKSIKKISSWRINKNENSYFSKYYNSHFFVLKRYPFSPEEQRMTIVGEVNVLANGSCNVTLNKRYSSELLTPKPNKYGLVISKGSPEIMLNYFNKSNLDEDMYKRAVHECTKQGYRILALGAKYININEKGKMRDFYENNLVFCGFLALYCPIKKHSKSVIEELANGGHSCIMVTGDNILTAFHVAKNVSITQKEDVIILSLGNNYNAERPSERSVVQGYEWRYSNGEVHSHVSAQTECELRDQLRKLNNTYCIGICGETFQTLTQQLAANNGAKLMACNLLCYCKIFARMSPKDKQYLINLYNSMGNVTLMCGDGTNDVGALKHSSVGISLLSEEVTGGKAGDLTKKNKTFYDIKREIEERVKNGERLSRLEMQKEILKELQSMDDVPKVKLGDASIASPFTYKGDSPRCIIKLVRYGRSTLTNLILMYKLMGLNSIVSAFSMSVLAYDGVKFGDFQTTFESVIMSGLFFLILRNKPLKKLVFNKPPNSIFTPLVFTSFALQALLHLLIIYSGWRLAHTYTTENGSVISSKIDGPFEPNIVNTTMYYLYTACHLSCFLSNANGYPYTTHILDNKYLIYVSIFVVSFLIITIMGVFPGLNGFFSLVLYQGTNLKLLVLSLIIADIMGTYLINYMSNRIYLLRSSKRTCSSEENINSNAKLIG